MFKILIIYSTVVLVPHVNILLYDVYSGPDKLKPSRAQEIASLEKFSFRNLIKSCGAINIDFHGSYQNTEICEDLVYSFKKCSRELSFIGHWFNWFFFLTDSRSSYGSLGK